MHELLGEWKLNSNFYSTVCKKYLSTSSCFEFLLARLKWYSISKVSARTKYRFPTSIFDLSPKIRTFTSEKDPDAVTSQYHVMLFLNWRIPTNYNFYSEACKKKLWTDYSWTESATLYAVRLLYINFAFRKFGSRRKFFCESAIIPLCQTIINIIITSTLKNSLLFTLKIS